MVVQSVATPAAACKPPTLRDVARRADKLAQLIPSPVYRRGLRFGVGATVEHRRALSHLPIRTAVDVGANKGQFSLFLTHTFPDVRVIAFEPLPGPAKTFCQLFRGSPNVVLNQAAIGRQRGSQTINVAYQEDSSSLLPITETQKSLFPGTGMRTTMEIAVGPLTDYVSTRDLVAPSLLKLDVQGYELAALRGCEALLTNFAYLYIECSFLELYAGQALAGEVIQYCGQRDFRLVGVHNIVYDPSGRAIQADFLFQR